MLAYLGFSPLTHMSVLLWKQLFFSIFMLLPAVALAAVTDSIKQAIAAAIGLFLLCVLIGMKEGIAWGPLTWILFSAMAAITVLGAITVLLAQYARRWTAFSRVVLVATAVTVPLAIRVPPWGPAYAIQSLFSKQHIDNQAVQISFDRDKTHLLEKQVPRPSFGAMVLPVRVDWPTGYGVSLNIDWASMDIDSPGTAHVNAGWETLASLQGPGCCWLTIPLALDKVNRIKGRPVHVHVSLALTLGHVDKTVVRPCHAPPSRESACLAPDEPEGYSPYPIAPWFTPVERYPRPARDLSAIQPRAHFRRSFDADLNLVDDYLASDN